jgi:GTP diphosphokinase / guanosine-3',5'-bis(diphosphate) 3'-diphosphatase
MADQHDETTRDPAVPGTGVDGVPAVPLGAMSRPDGEESVAVAAHQPVDRKDHEHDAPAEAPPDLTPYERELLADLFAIVEEHADEVARPVDRPRVIEAFVFACDHHADQRRQSGEDFIVHPVGVAKICAGM